MCIIQRPHSIQYPTPLQLIAKHTSVDVNTQTPLFCNRSSLHPNATFTIACPPYGWGGVVAKIAFLSNEATISANGWTR